jgi:hypothetical protein
MCQFPAKYLATVEKVSLSAMFFPDTSFSSESTSPQDPEFSPAPEPPMTAHQTSFRTPTTRSEINVARQLSVDPVLCTSPEMTCEKHSSKVIGQSMFCPSLWKNSEKLGPKTGE